jgi:multidrug efflux pump subunit AcrA (membrane-fusion protein)
MPAMTNPNPEPSPTSKPFAEPPKHPSLLQKVVLFLVVLIGAAGAIYYVAVGRQKAATQAAQFASIKTATVQRGNIESRLRLTGQTSARKYANVVAPRQRGQFGQGMVLLKIVNSGSFVHKGDIVAEVDPQSAKDRLDDTIDGLKDKENNVKKKKVDQELDMENLQQSLRQAKATLDKAILDQKTTQIRTDIDREVLALNVEEAAAAYKELLTDVPQKLISQKADLRGLEISMKIDNIQVERQQDDLQRFVLRATMDGMAVVQTMNRPGGDTVTLAIGDRVNPGMPLLKIIDPSSMQVEGSINQAESSEMRVGRAASVTLDAFPGSSYAAKVYAIGALATSDGRSQYFLRTVPVKVQISNPDARVIPDLSAAADVLLAKEDNVLTVPLSAVEQQGNETYVYVKNDQTFDKRLVKTGLSNGLVIAIREGLKEGEVVRIN